MHYTSIEQMLQMTRGGTVSGRAPTIIGDAILDAKSGDGPQIELAKQSLFEAMRTSEREIPGQVKSSPLTEQELTELSTGQVDSVLGTIRKKLVKRAKTGRNGSMKNIANYARQVILNLGESVDVAHTDNPIIETVALIEALVAEVSSDEVRMKWKKLYFEELKRTGKHAAAAKHAWSGIGSHFKQPGVPEKAVAVADAIDHLISAVVAESNLKPGDMSQGNYAEQKPKYIKSGYSTGEFALRTGATKSAGDCKPASHRGVDPGEPIGESDEEDAEDADRIKARYLADPTNLTNIKLYAYSTKHPPELAAKLNKDYLDGHAKRREDDKAARAKKGDKPSASQPGWSDAEKEQSLQTRKKFPGMWRKGVDLSDVDLNGDAVQETAMSDSENSKGAKAAGERKFDAVWEKTHKDELLKGISGKTGLKAPLKEAIVAFQETVELSDVLGEYNTATGKVTGQKVYTDPVATMAINSAYRTELLKLSSGKSAMAGKPGSVKSRDVKPGDPIGEDEIVEGSSGMRQLEMRRKNTPGMRAKQKFHDLRTDAARVLKKKNAGGPKLPERLSKSDLGSWDDVKLAKKVVSDDRRAARRKAEWLKATKRA